MRRDLAVERADAGSVEPDPKEGTVPVGRIVCAVAVAAHRVSVAASLGVSSAVLAAAAQGEVVA